MTKRRQATAARCATLADRRLGVKVRLRAIRRAAKHEFPTADIDRMLAEIEMGYEAHGPRRRVSSATPPGCNGEAASAS